MREATEGGLDHLAASGIVEVTPESRARALATVVHPGRFERIAGEVILDGAHNPDGAAALAQVLEELGLSPVLIASVSADKDAVAMARHLAARATRVIATRYQQDRAMPPDQLAAAFRGVCDAPVETAPELASALAAARRTGGPIVIAGSLFLVGEARVLLLGAPSDPIAMSDPAPPRA